jgi:hypothetical protein
MTPEIYRSTFRRKVRPIFLRLKFVVGGIVWIIQADFKEICHSRPKGGAKETKLYTDQFKWLIENGRQIILT